MLWFSGGQCLVESRCCCCGRTHATWFRALHGTRMLLCRSLQELIPFELVLNCCSGVVLVAEGMIPNKSICLGFFLASNIFQDNGWPVSAFDSKIFQTQQIQNRSNGNFVGTMTNSCPNFMGKTSLVSAKPCFFAGITTDELRYEKQWLGSRFWSRPWKNLPF